MNLPLRCLLGPGRKSSYRWSGSINRETLERNHLCSDSLFTTQTLNERGDQDSSCRDQRCFWIFKPSSIFLYETWPALCRKLHNENVQHSYCWQPKKWGFMKSGVSGGYLCSSAGTSRCSWQCNLLKWTGAATPSAEWARSSAHVKDENVKAA